MSRRNKPLEKKARYLERVIRKGRIPTKINLVEWLKDRGYADTTGQALKLIRAGRVKSESHTLDGKHTVPVKLHNSETGKAETVDVQVFSPLYPSSLRPTLRFFGG